MSRLWRVERQRVETVLVKQQRLRTNIVHASEYPLSPWEKIVVRKWWLISQAVLFGVLFGMMGWLILNAPMTMEETPEQIANRPGGIMGFLVDNFEWTGPGMIVGMWLFIMIVQVWSTATESIPTAKEVADHNAKVIEDFNAAGN